MGAVSKQNVIESQNFVLKAFVSTKIQVDFDKVQKVESGWDNENSNEEEDFW